VSQKYGGKAMVMQNVAIMRHGRMNGGGIAESSVDAIRRIANELRGHIGNCLVKVYSSSLERAELTAALLVEELNKCSVEATQEGTLDWLYCDSYSINDENIKTVASSEHFTILISHQPDVQNYIRKSARNCSIFAQNFSIPGE